MTKLAIIMRSTALLVVFLLTSFSWVVRGQAPVIEPAELLIQNGSNASLRCNTNNGVPDTSIYWEKLSGRANCPNINVDSASGTGGLSGSGQTLGGSSGSGQTVGGSSRSGLNISGSGNSGLTLSGSGLLNGPGQTLSGDRELEQYQLVGNGSVFEFAPVVFGDEGCYRCVAMGVASDPITVTVSPEGSVSVSPLNMVFERGNNVTFNCTAEGGPGNTYQWQQNGTNLDNETMQTLAITQISVNDGDQYTCVVSNAAGIDSATTSLFVYPEITLNPVDVLNATNGTFRVLACEAVAFPEPLYQWMRVTGTFRENVFGVNSSMLVFNPVIFGDEGGYYCTAASNNVTVTSENATLAVSPEGSVSVQPPTVITEPQGNVTFNCSVQGGPNISYQWQRNGASLLNEMSDILTIVNASAASGGNYTCIASNVAGSDRSTASLLVAPTFITQPVNQQVSNGSTTSFTCTAESFPAPEYMWEKSNEASSSFYTVSNGSVLEFTSAVFGDEGRYRCVASLPGTSRNATSQLVVLTVSPGGSVAVSPEMVIADVGGTVTFTCSAQGGPNNTYQWQKNGEDLMDETDTTLIVSNITAMNGGSYTCVVSNAAGNDSATAVLHVEPIIVTQPTDILTRNETVVNFTCAAESFPAPEYTWEKYSEESGSFDTVSSGPVLEFTPAVFGDEGSYRCVASLPGTSRNATSQLVVLTVSPGGSVAVSPEMVIADVGGTVTFTCSAQGGPNNTYQWQKNGEDLMDETDTTLIVSNITAMNGGSYTCVVSNAAGNDSATAVLHVEPIIVTQPTDILTRNGTAVNFTCAAESFPAPEYTWEKYSEESGSFDTVSSGPVLEFTPAVFGDEESYRCVASLPGTSRNATSDRAILTVSPEGSVEATPQVINAERNTVVNFTCSALGGPGNNFTWFRISDGAVVASEPVLQIQVEDAFVGSDYQCLVENDAGNDTTVVTLNVAPLILNASTDVNVTTSENFTLMCNATGYPAPSILWFHNGTAVNESSRITIILQSSSRVSLSVLSVSTAVATDSGIYTCNASSSEFQTVSSGLVNVLIQDRPQQPQNVRSVNITSRSISLVWDEPHSNNAPITGYRVMYQQPAFLGGSVQVVNSTVEMADITELHPGVTYNFTVVAFNEIGDSTPSNIASIRTLEEVPSGYPQDVQALTISAMEILVTWDPVPEIGRRGEIDQYEVQFNQSSFDEIPSINYTMTDGPVLMLSLQNLEAFVEYSIAVRAYTSVGAGPFSPIVNNQTFQDAPSSFPQDVTAATVSSTEILVSWDEVPAIDQNGIIILYEVQYEPLMIFSRQLMTIAMNTSNTSIVLGGLQEYVEYNISVRAYTIVGPGPFSPGVDNRTFEDAPSGYPQNVEPTTISSTEILVSWDEVPAIDQNGIIILYEVRYEPLMTFGGQLMTMTTNTSNTSIILGGLEEYIGYNITVRAFTSVGPGPFSPGVDNRTFEDTPSGYPQNVEPTTISSTEILVSWDEVPAIDQNGIIILYVVQYEPLITFGGHLMTMTMNTSNTSIVLGGLQEYVEYNITVRAFTSVGPGPFSPGVDNRTFEDAPSGYPQNVEPTTISSTEILVSWDEVPAIDQNGIIILYVVQYEPLMTFDGQLMTMTTNTSNTSIVLEGLQEYIGYNITVRAYTSVGPGPFSPGVDNRTFEDTPSGYPQNVKPTTISSTEILVSWDEVPAIDQNGIIILYVVQYEPLITFGGQLMTMTMNTSNTSIVLGGLQEYVEYNISVRAYTIVGPGPFSPGVDNRTFEDAPSGYPQNVEPTTISSTEILVSWDEVPAIDQNGIIILYVVRYEPLMTFDGQLMTMTMNTSNTSIVLGGLQEYVEYIISVRAYTIVGPGPFSPGVDNRTFEDAPSGYPQNVEPTTISSTEILVSWDEVPAIDQNGIIILYEVQYEPLMTFDGQLMTMTTNTSNTSIVLEGLQEYVEYNITVRAYTSVGPGPFSPGVDNRTFEDTPSGYPQNVEPTTISSTEILVSWDEVPAIDQNGIIILYEVRYEPLMTFDGQLMSMTMNTSNTSIVLGGLQEYVEYNISVRAYTSVGPGPFSPGVNNQTFEDAPSDYPQNVEPTTISSTEILVSWDEVPAIDQNGIIILYEIQYESLMTFGGQLMTMAMNTSNTSIVLGGLQEYVEYNISIRAYTIVGPGPFSPGVDNRTFEDAPSDYPRNVEPTTISSTEILVSWDEVPAIDQNGIIILYEVRYEPLMTFGGQLMTMTVNTSNTSIVLGGLQEYVEYNISVRAYTSVGSGPFSPGVDNRTFEDGPSDYPQNVEPTTISSTEILVSWDEVPAIDQNGIILLYEVQYEPLMTFDGQLMTMAMNTSNTSIVLGGLQEYVEYTITVRAYTSVGPGPFSPGVNNRTFEDVPNASPNNVQVLTCSSTAILVTWDPVPEISRNGIITQYEVESNQSTFNEIPSTRFTTTNGSVLMVELGGLEEYVEYTIRVRAYTSEGPGPFSVARVNRTLEDAPAAVPGSLTVVNISANELNVSWERPNEIDINGVLRYYILEYYIVNQTETLASTNVSGDTLSTVLRGLNNFTSYNVSVAAFTIDTGPFSMEVETTSENVPGEAPRNVRGQSDSSTSILVEWDRPREEVLYGILRGFRIRYGVAMDTNITTTTELIPEQQLSYTIQNLEEFTNYSIEVTAVTVGEGPYSSLIIVITDQDEPGEVPRPPPVPLGDLLSSFSVMVRWNHPTDPNGVVLRYIVNYVAVSSTPPQGMRRRRRETDGVKVECILGQDMNINRNMTVDGTQTSATLTELTPHTVYLFRVQAETAVGPGPFSSSRTFTTPENVPTEPRELTVMYLNSTALEVTWQQPLCDYGIRRGYTVTRDPLQVDSSGEQGMPGSPYNLTAEDTQLVITDLTPNTNYTITVCAFTNVGCGPLSSRANQTAEDALPYSPAGLAIGIIIIIITVIVIVVVLVILHLRRKQSGSFAPGQWPFMEGISGEVALGDTDQGNMRVIPNPFTKEVHVGTLQPVPVRDFADHVKFLHANDDYLFTEEYGAVEPDHAPTCEATLRAENQIKNRYHNITAYDKSRVKLHEIPGVIGSDYINANFLDGYKQPNAFIATQGPVPASIPDFWRMVWEQGSATIVMLTNLEERGRLKCHKYWPDEKNAVYGSIRVHIQDVLVLAEYTVRTFSLQREGSQEERIVRQFHFTVWPDHGVPESPTPLLQFVRKVTSSNPINAGPIVVHCSAGVGRTGTFVTIHTQLKRIEAENNVDIFGFVQSMRYRRCFMVQTEPQYIFIHDAILEANECGVTEVAARDLRDQYKRLGVIFERSGKTALQTEYEKVETSLHNRPGRNICILPVNKPKNRYTDMEMLPYDRSRCRLNTIPGQQGSDYINASLIDGYYKRNAFIATQGPLPDTTDDFWRMVWESKCATIVMLTMEKEGGRIKCHRYWPDHGAATYSQFQVILLAVNEYPDYIMREFKLVDTRDGSSLPVKQFQYIGWPEEGIPDNGGGLIDLIGQVQKWQRSSGDKPIVVHCSGGCGRTGTFIAVSILLERLKTEGVVDVFNTVRSLRLQRPSMVQSVDQYEFCYKSVLEFLDSFELYSNFK